jgi:uncharacterized protein YodC (DUF2158 family)
MPDENKFAVGDVVQLNSGGPQMTVEEVKGTVVSCVWFDAKQEQKKATFQAALLCKYSLGYS